MWHKRRRVEPTFVDVSAKRNALVFVSSRHVAFLEALHEVEGSRGGFNQLVRRYSMECAGKAREAPSLLWRCLPSFWKRAKHAAVFVHVNDVEVTLNVTLP